MPFTYLQTPAAFHLPLEKVVGADELTISTGVSFGPQADALPKGVPALRPGPRELLDAKQREEQPLEVEPPPSPPRRLLSLDRRPVRLQVVFQVTLR
jgi:hypothetical protein